MNIDFISGIFLNTVSGVLVAIFTLFVFHWLMSSKMQFSNNIRHIWLSKRKRPSYSIKIKKSGFIHLVDTQIQCRLAVRDVRKNKSDIWTFYLIPTTFENALQLKNKSRTIHLKLFEAKVYSNHQKYPYFQKNLKIARHDIGLRFEDFFMSYDEVYIQINVLGHDSFTGVKKLYSSSKYDLNVTSAKPRAISL